MSSGSKRAIVMTAIVMGAIAFPVQSYRSHAARTVHLTAPPVTVIEEPKSDPRLLRVCADPNNLPFSNDRGEGFENRLAETIGRALGKSVVYYWRPQRRGFLRATLFAGMCDVVMGVPASIDTARVTRPYYRSSYVFVSRRDRSRPVRSLDDARLRTVRIGIPITGDDYDNPPPAQALAVRHIVDNVRGYPVYGDYSQPHPSSGVVDAVRRGDVDVAIAWGPIAGYAARQPGAELRLTPLPDRDGSSSFAFDISMAVRRDDVSLAASLNDAISKGAADIEHILHEYGVPVTGKTLAGGVEDTK